MLGPERDTATPAAIQGAIDAGDPVRVLDVRDRDEVDRWRLAGPSVTLTQKPYNRFLQARITDSLDEFVADVDGSGPITVVCARGEASASVAEELADAGHDARNLEGGMAAWARLYLTTTLARPGGGPDGPPGEVDDDSSFEADGAPSVVQYRRPASGCLGYTVVAGGEAAVIDPLRAFTGRYVEDTPQLRSASPASQARQDAAERGVEIRYVVDTHVHADHVSGLRALADAADTTPVMPAPAADRGVAFDVETVTDGDTLALGGATLTAVRAPGHTTGMTAFAVRGDAATADAPPTLLTGDSLFVDGVARPDLERGADGAREFAGDLYRTFTERFDRFPDATLVAPGHHGEATAPGDGGVTATLGECRHLPVFSLSESAFVDRVASDLPPRPANADRIVAINLGRETADGDEAFELELGPNNCAAGPIDAD